MNDDAHRKTFEVATECPICTEKLPHASGETGQQCDRDIERNRIALELAERELTYDTRATPILRELARLRAVEETVRELRDWLDQERVVITQLRAANDLYRADVADLRAQLERLTLEQP